MARKNNASQCEVSHSRAKDILVLALPLVLLLSSCQVQEGSGVDSWDVGPEPSLSIELPDNSPVSFALIALEDDGASGTAVGCGDSAVLVTSEIPESNFNYTSQRIELALEALFVLSESSYGESGLYNALYQSDLEVSSVELTEVLGQQNIEIELTGTLQSGGVCDDPRIVAQIEETAVANANESATISIKVNGEALETYFDLSGQN